tara:strand:+ start:4308 stop:5243 length:936 start_codon:yes stop_codon:yes gene_type:complete
MITVGSLYSGVGGIDLGFQKEGFSISWSNEWDKNACITFRKNFKHRLIEKDIWDIDFRKLSKVDVLTAGFPCQTFSVAGLRKGFKEKRGKHFFRILECIDFLKPPVVFLENVKNLKNHNSGNTFKTIIECLKLREYSIHEKIINTKELTEIPQNRERIYIVCITKSIEKYKKFSFPNKNVNTKKINSLILKNYDSSLIYNDSFKHFETLKKEIRSEKTIYQWRRKYIRENKNNVCPTLTANMGTGGHNVPIIKQGTVIRKLSPTECFLFQGFPKKFKLPNIAKSHLYKQSGNSVSVPVIRLLAKEIKKLFL